MPHRALEGRGVTWKGWEHWTPPGETPAPSAVVHVTNVPTQHKYRALPTVVQGIRFASKKEGQRYEELRQLEAVGVIRDLVLQPPFDLHVRGGERVARYVADFAYVDVKTGERIFEDVKGVRTPMYRLKARWMKAEYGIDIVEV
ncbi:DUF1064 domain-containing protein [Luteitalea sp.]